MLGTCAFCPPVDITFCTSKDVASHAGLYDSLVLRAPAVVRNGGDGDDADEDDDDDERPRQRRRK